MDNIIFRFLLQCWPILVAAIASILLVYSWKRPKLTAEKLQKGLIQTTVVNYISADESLENVVDQDWMETRNRMEQYFNRNSEDPLVKKIKIRYREHISISLVWVLFWIGVFIFVTIRMIINPTYYGTEAIFLGYFAYYIILGLISYFRR